MDATTVSENNTPVPGGKIVILGDGFHSQKLLFDILHSQGYSVHIAQGYDHSEKIIAGQDPDLILITFDSKESDSCNTLKLIKNSRRLCRIPVILTGIFRDRGIKGQYLQAGFADYIEMPFQIDEVLCRVQTHIRLYRVQKELARQLTKKSVDLSLKKKELEETVIALKVLLTQHEADKKRLELTMLENLTLLIEPSLEKLKNTGLNDLQKTYLDIIASNLQHIASPLLKRTDAKFLKLTPSEIQIANLIKQGRPTKEIADILNLSEMTIATHRKNIRKKLGLTNKKQNLYSFLR